MGKTVCRFRTVIFLVILVAAGIFLASGESTPAATDQPGALAGPALSPAGSSALHGIVDSARNADLRWPDFAPYKSEFGKLYQANNYSLVWIQNGRLRSQALVLIELLKNAGAKGLDPEDYDGPRWQNRLLKLDHSPSEQDLVSFDTARFRRCATFVPSIADASTPRNSNLSLMWTGTAFRSLNIFKAMS
jgi:Scaffold domain